ncbi:amidase family protein [Acuticoccus sp. MNP-M23]|uniref:amidase family protein n=1 Tax=Acuticoccus sp. MNP-M23 TaxID=3072793 RepID=UPI0028155A7C|nr:amidase family protein [Acuticoccus sp. MNP-M23]WMS44551.1 amidase family protein [Acuticoccus sp. MNP-M23]
MVLTGAGSDDAFLPGPRCERPATGHGRLNGLRLAVKDLFDIEGEVTGAGVPDWAAAEAPAAADAAVVRLLREAGARVVGKTITDELAYSLEGENPHYGTPLNPRDPAALPGGSSSGSASAVAGGHADIALGTDTGGSVRVPAAFCGIFGIRPSHGATSFEGMTPFAPSYDTVGWSAQDAAMLEAVGDVLLAQAQPATDWRFRLAHDALALCEPDAALGALTVARATGAEAVDVIGDDYQQSTLAYAAVQNADIRTALGPRLKARQPYLGPAAQARFDSALFADPAEVPPARRYRNAARKRFLALVPEGVALIMPTVPVSRLPRDGREGLLESFYARALALNAVAGHAGAPQVHLPRFGPAGVSLLARPGSDRALLTLAHRLAYVGV